MRQTANPIPTRFNGARFLTRVILAVLGLLCLPQPAMAREMANEQSVLAAMVFNFLKFTEFPAESDVRSPGVLRLCTAIREPQLVDALAALSGRKVKGRELIVEILTTQSTDCDVLYVDSHPRWRDAVERPPLRRALSISAYPGFARDDGMIEIDVRGDGVRFEINLVAGRRAGLHFAPQLLRLARQVHE